ncbi:ATPase [Sphingopyxis sp. H038]|uniref:ATP12 family chaperone protein n=1 Tax=unclassified Sphingopyxis TaxID=2614943 RepID=UPI00072FFE3A|nr:MULTISPECIES: ATP12 family protein [unclassified Sphingopyxis]KTE00474.1 ATPase [Sphingopyxis sp. H012]KTE08359.1 ATPase [Sphingopyxis sp. H053]KTE12993.1 ATPase [Sphingopyxis sp. H093]KTE26914.1 ATPase [Sphingopyxis sp. H080]KTE33100.1 ATPase [Sphingopyxis sp. H038]
MKRFWKEVAVAPEDGGWGIALDGRPVRTPQRAPLAVASAALAEAIAAEWRNVGETIDPAAMPMTGLTNAAIDLATPDLAAFAAPVAAYAQSDLFCYRDARDAALQAEQAAAWNPLLAWAEARYGIEFTLTQGVLPVDQPEATVAVLQGAVFVQDAWRITALTPLVTIGGSLVAGLALLENVFDADALWETVSLDELYQERRWGADSEAQKARAIHKRDWDNAARFLNLV